MSRLFDYSCPHCESTFVGEMDEDLQGIDRVIVCEDCEGRFKLLVEAIPEVSVEKYRP